ARDHALAELFNCFFHVSCVGFCNFVCLPDFECDLSSIPCLRFKFTNKSVSDLIMRLQSCSIAFFTSLALAFVISFVCQTSNAICPASHVCVLNLLTSLSPAIDTRASI